MQDIIPPSPRPVSPDENNIGSPASPQDMISPSSLIPENNNQPGAPISEPAQGDLVNKSLIDHTTPQEARKELAATPLNTVPIIEPTGREKHKISTLTFLVGGFILLAILVVLIWVLTMN